MKSIKALVATGATLAAVILIWPGQDVKDRAKWARNKYLAYCAKNNLPMRMIDTNGANTGGRYNLCYDETGVVSREISGRCWTRPALSIHDARNGNVIELTHPDCKEQEA